MRLFLDTNILIDIIEDRMEFAADISASETYELLAS